MQRGALLNEASLSRVWRHYKRNGFAILTSWRGDASREANLKRFNILKSQLRRAGFGFIPIIGVWHEEGMEKPEEEPSLFVPAVVDGDRGAAVAKKLRRLAVSLGARFEQDAVVWSPGGAVEIISTHTRTGTNVGTPMLKFDKFNPRAVGIAYSKLAKRSGSFTFESVEDEDSFDFYFQEPPRGSIEAFLRAGQGEMAFVADES